MFSDLGFQERRAREIREESARAQQAGLKPGGWRAANEAKSLYHSNAHQFSIFFSM